MANVRCKFNGYCGASQDLKSSGVARGGHYNYTSNLILCHPLLL